jgi:predicted TIM-barrel fold metal-dependent hydrolase
MREPEQAAHAMGKLIRYCGEDNVLWGTDSIWYGSPQDQIQAFRSFQIGRELREKHGYAEMTRELRARIFGLNAAKVYGVTPTMRKASAERDPHFLTYGPKTRREFLTLIRHQGGH